MAAKRSVAQRSGEPAARATRDATKKKRNKADRSGTEWRRRGEARKHEPARATIGEPTRSDANGENAGSEAGSRSAGINVDGAKAIRRDESVRAREHKRDRSQPRRKRGRER